MSRNLAVLGAVFLAATLKAPADGLIVVRPHGPSPTTGASYTPLEVRDHHVTVKVSGRVATTEVDQTFFNPSSSRLEGTYLFPIPRGAQIDRFSMDVNGRMTEAELLDAEKARRIYEDIVRTMRDPALLEYVGQGLYKVRIFPIEPRADKRIRLKYTELLSQEGGLLSYVYPLNTEKFSAQPLKSVSLKVDVELPEGLRSVYSPSHEVEVKRHGPTRAVVGFESRDVKPDTDFQLFLAPATSADVGVHVMTHRDPSDPEGTFLLILSPSSQMSAEKVVQKDVVFVLDTSGSMAEDRKLEQARKALSFCLKNLNKGDRFEVVRFSTETEPLFGDLVAADERNLERAEAFVSGLKPIGGTAIEAALVQALEPLAERGRKDRPYVVVFLTDGLPTVGSTDPEEILRQVSRRAGDRTVRVFCFGIGTNVNTHLLDRLAESSRGASQYVVPGEDLELKLSGFYTKISQPVLAGPALRVESPRAFASTSSRAGDGGADAPGPGGRGGRSAPAEYGSVRVTKLAPPELPDLFRGEQLVVFGRYTGSGAAVVTLSGTVNGQPRRFTHEVSFPARSTEHAFVPRLWATRRVGYLLDQIRLHGESAELREEVLDLARSYGIVTPFTAYLVLEDEERRNVATGARTIQAPGGAGRDAAMRATSGMYKDVKEKKSGDAAVGGAQALDSLKRAENADAPAASNKYAFYASSGLAAPSATAPSAALSSEPARQLVKAQAARFVRGRTFYQNGNVWVDANVQAKKAQRTRQVRFASKEYTELLGKHPDAPQWLSVGRNVQLVLEGTVYEVVD